MFYSSIFLGQLTRTVVVCTNKVDVSIMGVGPGKHGALKVVFQ